MKQINIFLQEKLKLNKDIEISLDELDDYNGVHLITQNDMSKRDFERYGSISLKLAYKIAKKIIDYFGNELEGYYFSLFYSGYSGFIIYGPNHDINNDYDYDEKLGIIEFLKGAKIDGTLVVYYSSKDSKYNDISKKIQTYIGKESEKFK